MGRGENIVSLPFLYFFTSINPPFFVIFVYILRTMDYEVLIVEDEKKIADTLKTGLEELNYKVTVAYNGMEGTKVLISRKFDLIILDLNLPFVHGYELCQLIRQQDSKVPIIILTALNLLENKVKGFDLGADDYIPKPFEFRELVARMQALLRRTDLSTNPDPSSSILSFEDLELNLYTKEVRRQGKKISLTAKEMQLLEYFMRYPGKVISREEISKNVWDIDFDTQTNVIDVYVNFLRRKIDKEFDQKLIQTVVGMGYVLRTETEE